MSWKYVAWTQIKASRCFGHTASKDSIESDKVKPSLSGYTPQNDQLPLKQRKYGRQWKNWGQKPSLYTEQVMLFVFINKAKTCLRITSVTWNLSNEMNYLYFARFCISLKSYHEMSQAVGGKDLSRSYIVDGCQASPDKGPWAELSFKQLLKLQLQRGGM